MKSSLFLIHCIACKAAGTTGSGGHSSEEYFRLLAFGHRETVTETVKRIRII